MKNHSKSKPGQNPVHQYCPRKNCASFGSQEPVSVQVGLFPSHSAGLYSAEGNRVWDATFLYDTDVWPNGGNNAVDNRLQEFNT